MAIKKGTALADNIVGTAAADQLFGFAGNDKIFGGAGNDFIDGGAGNDTIDGGAGNDRILGGLGNDNIKGGLGNDTINGGAGNDIINGGDGNNIITGGLGNDTMIGGTGDDTFIAGPGVDSITGGANSAFVFGAFFATGFVGGDWLSYADSTTAVGVDITSSGAALGGALGDTWTGVENLQGSNFNDVLVGGDSGVSLSAVYGGAGNDIINSGTGLHAVLLRGDDGTDFLFGNAAHEDDFVLQYGHGLDWITEFQQGGITDALVLSLSEFGLAGGALTGAEFANFGDPFFGTAAIRLIYETDTHILWADKDGNGTAFTAEAIAVIQGPGGAAVAGLNLSDFALIA